MRPTDRDARGSPPQVRWPRRYGWKIGVPALLVAGCVGRYWSPVPDREVTVTLLAPVGSITQQVTVTSPTLLGWVAPGRVTRLLGWGLENDGRDLLIYATRGQGDVVATARITSRSADRVGVQVTILDPLLPLGRNAAGYYIVVRVPLDPPADPANPSAVFEEGSGETTPVTMRIEPKS